MQRSGRVAAIVVAAGGGERFGGEKQFRDLAGAPLLQWSVSRAAEVAGQVVVAVAPARVAEWAGRIAAWGAHAVVAGGATRSASVRAGLAAVGPDAEVIVVHDGARPLASAALWGSVISTLDAADGTVAGVVPAIAPSDTLKEVDGERVVRTLSRTGIVAVQTPQAFRASALRRAHRDAVDATDDASLVEGLGLVIGIVPGEAGNAKVTYPTDLIAAAALCARCEQPGAGIGTGTP